MTARALLDGQAAAVRESYADRPELRGEMMLVLAEGYERLGLFTEALAWAEEALALRTSAPQAERAAAATLVGWTLHQLGRTDEALPALEAAVADARRDGEGRRTLARALSTTWAWCRRPWGTSKARVRLIAKPWPFAPSCSGPSRGVSWVGCSRFSRPRRADRPTDVRPDSETPCLVRPGSPWVRDPQLTGRSPAPFTHRSYQSRYR